MHKVYKEVLASALVPEKLSAIGRFLKYSIYGKRSWYIAHCPLYGRCPLFGVSAKRGSHCTYHTACVALENSLSVSLHVMYHQ